jgi:uncharacterized protein
MLYNKRTYRECVSTENLVSFSLSVKETDLFISASENLEKEAKDAVLQARLTIENYINKNPDFKHSLVPLPFDRFAPEIIKKMLRASSASGVGPMAAVAGAVAEHTGTELLKYSTEVIIENGGDIFFKISRDVTVGIFAAESPLSEHIGIKISSSENPFSVCTSSGRVGPSLSFGSADAVTIKSASPTLADAAATAIGNMIEKHSDIQRGIDEAKKISMIDGVLIIKDEHLGVWGNMELVSL